MRSENDIVTAAAAAAERANGGKFSDPLFFKTEHQAFWQDVIRTAFAAVDSKPARGAIPRPTVDEVKTFSEHCVYIRSVFRFMLRIWRDSNNGERELMEATAPLFFEDMGKVLGEFAVIAACRITDPATDRQGNQNFTIELFINGFEPASDTYKVLDALQHRMGALRSKVLPARNKLGAHADRKVISEGQVLEGGTWDDWKEFWTALADFVRIINEKIIGAPFEIEAGGIEGDAEVLLKTMRQSRYFEELLNGKDKAITDACLKVALPNSAD